MFNATRSGTVFCLTDLGGEERIVSGCRSFGDGGQEDDLAARERERAKDEYGEAAARESDQCTRMRLGKKLLQPAAF